MKNAAGIDLELAAIDDICQELSRRGVMFYLFHTKPAGGCEIRMRGNGGSPTQDEVLRLGFEAAKVLNLIGE